ncbi:MAG TPA: MBOAT family protein [Firmicutes bacterium]|nr:MBOAT family protein [Bacillota bacterium]
MVFSSLIFLFAFLPAVLALYYLAPRRGRNLVLFLASLFFYAWGEPVYIVLMLFSTLADYTCGQLLARWGERKGRARLVLLVSLAVNLGLLGFFKYAGFAVQAVNSILGTSFAVPQLPLPVGISFYTFQTMSYTIDVYRGQIPAQRDFVAFGTYVSLFPQLIAGPIVRYREVAEQLLGRRENVDGFGAGARRFILGLGKKVLLANNVGLLWEEVQLLPPSGVTVLAAWLGMLAFALQIYFDFSGYSDMAIGLGKMFGFTFPENFAAPYLSTSITDFWRRWHISLGTWFREYVYLPLGGSRAGRLRLVRNLLLVWALTGLWHGASWNFLLWGLYYGVLLTVEKLFLLRRLRQAPQFVRHFYTLFFVLVGWVFFAITELPVAFAYLRAMLGGVPWADTQALYFLANYGVLLGAALVCCLPLARAAEAVQDLLGRRFYLPLAGAMYAVLLFVATAYLVDATFNPFLYFRF